MKKLNRLIDRFCTLHPGFGIPNLMLYIAIGNIAVFLLSLLPGTAGANLIPMLAFNLSGILHGEVWRLLTFVFVPNVSGVLSLLLSCYFCFWIGGTLEREWGTAKFTVYYVSGAVLTMLATVIMSLLYGNMSISLYGTYYVNLAMFFAFAMLYPDAQVLLFFIIPIRMKVLAIIDACLFAFDLSFCLVQGNWVGAMLPVMAMLNFAVFFAPQLQDLLLGRRARSRQTSPRFRTAERRKQVEQQSAQTYHHRCSVCGRTDAEHPELQFRYCSKCAGYHCYCSDHIFSHVHFTEENP